MKKLRYMTYLVLALFAMQSCTKDFLELEPKTGLTEATFYKTEKDALLALTAVYQAMAVQNWQFIPLMADIFSDDANAGGDATGTDMQQWQDMEKSMMTPENNSAADLWNRCYTGIYRANLYLEKESGVTWTNAENQKRFIAEAKFIRGYIYYDLARHYGWVPIITTVLPSIEDYRAASQNTPAEVYKQAITDLLAAIPDLPESVPPTEVGRVTQHAAKALVARVWLYYNGIKTAIPELGLSGELTDGTTVVNKQYVQTALEDIISSGAYSLLPNYADLFDWAHQNNAESILEFQYSEKAKSGDWNSGGWGFFGNFSVIFYGPRNPKNGLDTDWDAGWSFGTVTWSLVNEFEAGDPRLEATALFVDPTSGQYDPGYANTGYFNKKWMPRRAFRPTSGSRELNYPANFMDIRYADVLLMAAEVFLNDNQGKALDYLNQVRTRAMGAAAAKSTVTMEDILHERRVELGGEGSRKWDLLRNGLDYAKAKIDAACIAPSGATNKHEFLDRKFDTQTWGMFPIPGKEIRNCNAGVLTQYVPKYK